MLEVERWKVVGEGKVSCLVRWIRLRLLKPAWVKGEEKAGISILQLQVFG